MQISRRNAFTTIRTDGGLLPADLLLRIAEGDRSIDGLTPETYHLAKSERLNEAATRAWNRLQGAWEGFRAGMDKLPESDAGTTLTRERWLLILFQELGYGRLQTAKSIEIHGKTYPVSHIWQSVPIHLVSFRQELDRRSPGARGASRASPHSLLQELLNRGEGYLWGFVSNGLRLRLLRDNVSLTRAACVEFDLQSMMEGEVYSDFFLLFLLCHQSRVEVPEGKTIEHCWLERWYNTSLREGTRVLDHLRDGVEKAIEALGGGFLSHPANTALRDKLRAGTLSTQDYYRQVLRVVYRLLFLFVAEDRDLLLLPAGEDPRLADARELYIRYYSTQRLRRLAERRRSARHADLYRALRLVFAKLHSGCMQLALPALGSYLFAPTSTPDLDDADIANADLLVAVWNLTFTADNNVRRSVDYRNLGPEELGSVYESLLEMRPDVNLDAGRFTLTVAAGSERKTTGSYYTPSSLVNCLLDSALDPVLDEACQKPDPEQALLDLKVCDPACGSGHFLIAAAHRIAKRLAAIRAGEDEPAPESIQHALRDVVGRCIYGVDVNPMAVELCKINLWLEALEPGRPLSFLDHHIRCGNSLLGTTPALMKRGIPDDAFKPIEGDDRAVCSELKRRNRDERRGQGQLAFDQPQWLKLGNFVQSFANLTAEDDSTPQALAAKERHFVELVRSTPYENAWLLADAWCAAFVCEKRGGAPLEITQAIFRRWEANPHHITPAQKDQLLALREQYKFFHWHLAFPEVFKPKPTDQIDEDELTGWSGGFDAILGNPPYGAAQSHRERLLLNSIQPVGSATANSAADFLLLCQRAIRPNRRVGLVVPKSLTYSFSWVPVRDDLLPSIEQVIDVSEAWEEVLLEQVLVTYTSRLSDTNAPTQRLGRMTGSTIEWAVDEASEAVQRFGIIPTGLTERDTQIVAAMLRNSDRLLDRICATQRGTGLQSLVVTDGTIPVLAGRDIADFELRPIERFITEDILARAPVRLTQGPTAVFQNIVAHITRPENHIKLTGCVVTDRVACLDTVNLVTPLSSDVSPWAIAAFLMSDIVNWFVYVCIYNRAVRTMHFDGYFLRKIPVPKTDLFGILDQHGKALSEEPRNKALWGQLNDVVYAAFGVPSDLAIAISKGRKPRW
ncbi:Eco57I restriction-modification methylase domain-containing protein [Fontivita pretiosa]|uniref:Eco57I restriction-modification methylase domain-containing protein n=1 Tax=Fontivita pretiosa TaxID=2989684 RepID=UPI003D17FBD9